MLDNFRKTAVVKKIWILNYSFITYDSTEKIHMQLCALKPLFKIFCTFVYENFSSCPLEFPGKNCRQIYGKSKASTCRYLSTAKFVSRILCCVALVYNTIHIFFRSIFLRKLFNIRFSYKHCNFSCSCLLIKMASNTVTRSIRYLQKLIRGWNV